MHQTNMGWTMNGAALTFRESPSVTWRNFFVPASFFPDASTATGNDQASASASLGQDVQQALLSRGIDCKSATFHPGSGSLVVSAKTVALDELALLIAQSGQANEPHAIPPDIQSNPNYIQVKLGWLLVSTAFTNASLQEAIDSLEAQSKEGRSGKERDQL